MQKVKIPDVLDCWCGEAAEVIDWNDRFMYRYS